MSIPIEPTKCTTMAQVRHGVDETDRQLMQLLDKRFAYMRAAARIKPDRASVRDEDRKTEVVRNATADAQARELPAAKIGDLWDLLVEISIAYEMQIWDAQKG